MPSTCKTKDCKKSASYGPPNSRSRVACATHKTDEMECKKIDSRKCLNCNKRASFGLPGEKAKYCVEHAPQKTINVNAKTCIMCNEHQPSFGIKNGRPTHCASCSKKSTTKLYDLVSVLCEFEDCQTNPIYGFVNEKARRCKIHMEDGMIDVKNKKCEICIAKGIKPVKQSTFGFDKPIACKVHKTDDMRDLRHDSEKCERCDKRSTYGYQRAIRCSYHKEDDMKDMVSQMCIICNEYQPCYNLKNEPPLFCLECKADKMVDVKHPKCISCGLFNVYSKGDSCANCNLDGTAYQKIHEMKVINYLRYKNVDFAHNKSLGRTWNHLRPDVLVKCDTGHHVIVEIDEKQHKGYDEQCEIIRMFTIQQALKNKVVFIRYNPDIFYIKGKRQNISDEARLDKLYETIQMLSTTPLADEIKIYKLFYNDMEFGEVTNFLRFI